jgi:peptide deformylase
MIVTDREKLKIRCRETTLEECEFLSVFPQLDSELNRSSVPGLGLAANQIGLEIRVCTVRPKPDQVYNMINPVIEEKELPFFNQNEGCLSFPGVRLNTNRYNQITCSWLDYDSKENKRGVFYGMEAIIVQHEVDHINGILFWDRVAKVTEKIGRNDPCPICEKDGVHVKWKKCKKHNIEATR